MDFINLRIPFVVLLTLNQIALPDGLRIQIFQKANLTYVLSFLFMHFLFPDAFIFFARLCHIHLYYCDHRYQ